MKRIFIFALVAVCAATEAFAWGGKGHDVVAYVAECHLSRRAAKRITKILDGHSPVYYANWMDNTALRMLIHLMGDLHCPMHAGHKSDLGGNTVEVKFFGEPTRLHTVWDTHLVEAAHKWGYTEWQREIDRLAKRDRQTVCEGSIEDWFAETVDICGRVYDEIPAGTNLSYDEVARYAPLIEEQLLKGGLRLAAILNSIY